MTTIDKKGKPKIYTESDQILNDLKDELVNLRSRMNSIEEEQEQNRAIIERLSLHEELANEMIVTHQEEIKQNKENFQIIADVMQNLKSPVSEVMDNLSGVLSEIDDKETQETLRDCLNTASNVLDSFDEVEDFCLSMGSSQTTPQKMVVIREFFRDILSKLQSKSDSGTNFSFSLLIDRNVPEKSPLHTTTLNTCLTNLINELQQISQSCKITVTVSTEDSGKKYGIDILDLSIKISCEIPTSLEWEDSWVHSIRNNQKQLMESGFNLLKVRDILKKSGGYLNIISKNKKIQGFAFRVPLTY